MKTKINGYMGTDKSFSIYSHKKCDKQQHDEVCDDKHMKNQTSLVQFGQLSNMNYVLLKFNAYARALAQLEDHGFFFKMICSSVV